MRYLLDTNAVSDLIRTPQGGVARRVAKVGEEQVCTSIFVACELRYGAARKGSAALSARVESVLGALEVLPVDVPFDRRYGAVRAALESRGKVIGALDLMIAVHALELGHAVVTANLREFRQVPGLRVENWQTP